MSKAIPAPFDVYPDGEPVYNPPMRTLDLIAERFTRLTAAIRKGTVKDVSRIVTRYAGLLKDAGGNPRGLAVANPKAALLGGADDKAKSIPFIVTTVNEDRDGDVVIPRGIEVKDYAHNPVSPFEVSSSRPQKFRGVPKAAKPVVAVGTQEAANLPGSMAVVYGQCESLAVNNMGFLSLTDGTNPALLFQHSFVLFYGQAEPSQLAFSDPTFIPFRVVLVLLVVGGHFGCRTFLAPVIKPGLATGADAEPRSLFGLFTSGAFLGIGNWEFFRVPSSERGPAFFHVFVVALTAFGASPGEIRGAFQDSAFAAFSFGARSVEKTVHQAPLHRWIESGPDVGEATSACDPCRDTRSYFTEIGMGA